MFLNTLDMYQFRNIESQHIHFSPELNFIIGKNGQGKTNLVEAIHILSTGKSFRTTSLKQVIGWDYSEASLACSLMESVSDVDLRIILRSRAREYSINNTRAVSLSEYIGQLITVCFSPGDLEIVRGGPAERRKCIDKHIVDAKPASLKYFTAYQRALKNKNALLKSGNASNNSIAPWNQILAREGMKISLLRQEFLFQLEEAVNEVHAQFGSADGAVSFELNSFGLREDGSAATESELLEKLNKNIKRDQILKVAELGVHRDDIKILLDGKDSRVFASQGQVRSVVLSLKLGVIALLETARGESPIVLLDDVDSELDKRRSDSFFDLLLRQGRQVIITGTAFDENRLKSSSTNVVYEVDAGLFSAQGKELRLAI